MRYDIIELLKLMKTRNKVFILFLFILLLGCFSLFKIYNAKKNKLNPLIQINRETQNEISIPVTILPTENNSEPYQLTYPNSVNVSGNSSLLNQIAAYGTANLVVIGPKDWTGKGVIGGNGTVIISLFPTNGSTDKGPHITISDIIACWSCALIEAGPYFESARNELIANHFTVPEPIVGLELNQIDNQLVKYSIARTSDKLEVNGLIKVSIENKKISSPVKHIEVVLTPKEKELADLIIEKFNSDISQKSKCEQQVDNKPDIIKYTGKISAVNFETQPKAKEYYTLITNGVATGPNFAGHYYLARWGCGTDTVSYAIIDVINGDIVAYEGCIGQYSLRSNYDLNTRILVLDPVTAGNKIKYYKLNEDKEGKRTLDLECTEISSRDLYGSPE